jgi:hypothetical protein
VIREIERYHGVVLSRLVRGARVPIRIVADPKCRSAYQLNGKVVLYVKYSTNRMSPWSFVFKPEHHTEIATLARGYQAVFVLLVCGTEGIACLAAEDYERVLMADEGFSEWVRVARRPRTMFIITGGGGLNTRRIGDNEFPMKVLAALG